MIIKTCPHCNGHMEEVLDLYHNDWSRDCQRCGYSVELLPRSNTRMSRRSRHDDYDTVAEGVEEFLHDNPAFALEEID